MLTILCRKQSTKLWAWAILEMEWSRFQTVMGIELPMMDSSDITFKVARIVSDNILSIILDEELSIYQFSILAFYTTMDTI